MLEWPRDAPCEWHIHPMERVNAGACVRASRAVARRKCEQHLRAVSALRLRFGTCGVERRTDGVERNPTERNRCPAMSGMRM